MSLVNLDLEGLHLFNELVNYTFLASL